MSDPAADAVERGMASWGISCSSQASALESAQEVLRPIREKYLELKQEMGDDPLCYSGGYILAEFAPLIFPSIPTTHMACGAAWMHHNRNTDRDRHKDYFQRAFYDHKTITICDEIAPPHHTVLTPAKDVVCACGWDPGVHWPDTWEDHAREVL